MLLKNFVIYFHYSNICEKCLLEPRTFHNNLFGQFCFAATSLLTTFGYYLNLKCYSHILNGGGSTKNFTPCVEFVTKS